MNLNHYVWVWVCVWVSVCCYVNVQTFREQGHRKVSSVIFLCLSPHYCLEKVALTEPEVCHLALLSGQEAPSILFTTASQSSGYRHVQSWLGFKLVPHIFQASILNSSASSLARICFTKYLLCLKIVNIVKLSLLSLSPLSSCDGRFLQIPTSRSMQSMVL